MTIIFWWCTEILCYNFYGSRKVCQWYNNDCGWRAMAEQAKASSKRGGDASIKISGEEVKRCISWHSKEQVIMIHFIIIFSGKFKLSGLITEMLSWSFNIVLLLCVFKYILSTVVEPRILSYRCWKYNFIYHILYKIIYLKKIIINSNSCIFILKKNHKHPIKI